MAIRMKSQSTSLFVQARLNSQSFAGDPSREQAAIDVHQKLLENGWTTRQIVCESFIALGEKLDGNWKAPTPTNETRMTAQMMGVFSSIQSIVERLSKLDFSGFKNRQDVDEIVESATAVQNFFADTTWFDEEED